MLREIAHFVWNGPRGLALKAKLSQASLYENVMDRADAAGLASHRAALVRGLSGRVLEIGAGTGRMFRFYERDVDLVALEPDDDFAAHAAEAKAAAACRVEIVEGRAEQLPFEDGSFDAVVVALVLCSVEHPDRVVAEVHRVLRPGGELRVLEHVKSPRRVAGALMHAFDPVWLKLNGQGCHMDRDPIPVLERAGFAVEVTETFQIFAPVPVPAFPMVRLRARRA